MTLNGSALKLKASDGDIAENNAAAGNIFLQSANSDWTVNTKLSCSKTPGSPAQNAGLLAYQDDDNFVKFVYAAPGFRRGQAGTGTLQLSCVAAGNSKSSISVSLEGVNVVNNTLWLRLVKKGSVYTAYYSTDGKKYVEAGKVDTLLKDIKAGLIACNGVLPARFAALGRGMQAPADNTPFEVSFDFFKIAQ